MSALGAIGAVFGGLFLLAAAAELFARAVERKPNDDNGTNVSTEPVPVDQQPGRAAMSFLR